MYVTFDLFLYACASQILLAPSSCVLFAILESCVLSMADSKVFSAEAERTRKDMKISLIADVIRLFSEHQTQLKIAKAGVQHFVLAFRASGGLREIVWMAGIGYVMF